MKTLTVLLLTLTASSFAYGQDDVSASGAGGDAASGFGGGPPAGDASTYSSGTWAPSGIADEGGGEAGVDGGDFVSGVDTSPGLYGGKSGGVAVARKIPKYHDVAEGETLWDICKYYYNDPWAWPQLWAENSLITNPHWIYPGDKIKMVGYREASQSRPSRSKEVIRYAGGTRFQPGPTKLSQHAYVDPDELDQAGTVVGSKVARVMLSDRDEVYIEGSKDSNPAPGRVYTVYKVDRDLKGDGKKYGKIVEIVGSVRLKKVNDEGVATGVITSSRIPVERGYYVGPLRRVYQRVSAVPAEESLRANVIDAFREGELIGTDDIVFLDKGANAGVRLGNRFLVARRGDGYRTVYQDKMKDNPRFPFETTAEILVVDVRKNASVGIVTRASAEVRKDDFVQMRRGY